ncbi:MAG: TadE/TadG family type IV pilus assembly protein [Anaerolineae bacterium]|nr:pilus assembly protein [Anaerolineae bacterium]MDW8067343.1 TadE/TadG family type IV pilus assembly protein [Anaerolineae bacterium]
MNGKKVRQSGQSIVELAVILPFLILLIIGMVETALALRSYLLVTTACREGVRFVARARYTDEDAARWMLNSGGYTTLNNQQVLFFRASPPDPNTGIIITHIPIQSDGTRGDITRYLTGTMTVISGTAIITRPITVGDSRVAEIDLARHENETRTINQQRVAAGYEALDNRLVVVEVFYAHWTLWNYRPLGLPRVLQLYSRSVMRVVSDARQSQ